jgi:ribosomal protein L37AE/L43A
MNDEEVYCPECGCDEVTIYGDGYCQCNGCGYEWYVE